MAEPDVYDTSSNELRPFVIVTESALQSWAGYYEVVKCIDCNDSFFESGELMPEVKGIGISFASVGPMFMKPHFKTSLDICFSEHRKTSLNIIDCFGQGLASYTQRKTGKTKVVSLGAREDKFFYKLHDDFSNEYDKIVAVKDLKSGIVTLTRELKKIDPKTKKYRVINYKVKLKLKKIFTIKVNLKL